MYHPSIPLRKTMPPLSLPSQTGLACFFDRQHRLQTLPCSFLYDISVEHHLVGKEKHRSCLAWSGKGKNACRQIAKHSEIKNEAEPKSRTPVAHGRV